MCTRLTTPTIAYARSRAARYVLCMKSPDVCPICSGPRRGRPENQAYPFCSRRCKLADLGNWLGGHYALGGEAANDEDTQGERDKLS
jgi:endogenous inhibitor of DNA gyrase (YacG/DUF329 family)